MNLILSPAAEEDLNAIWHYLGVEVGNTEAAHRTLRSIRDALLILPQFPHLGRPCHELAFYVPGLKAMPVVGYTIYYTCPDKEIIHVGRILHDRRDRERLIMKWAGL